MKKSIVEIKKEKKKTNSKEIEVKEEDKVYKEYKKYIKSKSWKETCDWIYENVYQKKCYCCGRLSGDDNAVIQLHHNSYDYLYNEKEHPECVIPLCASCHRRIHSLPSNWKRFSRKNLK